MTAPTPLHLDLTDYPPPHGVDHTPCSPCDRLRRQLGVRMRPMSDQPKHGPAGEHYGQLSPMPIDVIEAWGLGYGLGAAIKYIARHGRKPGVDAIEDLSKAAWFIQREIARLKQGGSHES